jgi:maltose/moltooligosaccharide transporter
MPYAILSGCLPKGKTGIYMGIFNFFIVIPEIVAALGFGKVMEKVLTNDSALVKMLGGDNRLTAVVIGGLALGIAAVLMMVIVRAPASKESEASAPELPVAPVAEPELPPAA